MEKPIVLAKVQVLVYIPLNIILSLLLPEPTYNEPSNYCNRGDLQAVFFEGFINKHDLRSAGPRNPVCTSQRTQPASITKNSHDKRSQTYVGLEGVTFSLKKKEDV